MPVARSLASRRRGIQHDPIDAAPSASNERRACVRARSCGRYGDRGRRAPLRSGMPPNARQIDRRVRARHGRCEYEHARAPTDFVDRDRNHGKTAGAGVERSGHGRGVRRPARPRDETGTVNAAGATDRGWDRRTFEPWILRPSRTAGGSPRSGAPCGPLTGTGFGRARAWARARSRKKNASLGRRFSFSAVTPPGFEPGFRG